MIYRGKRTQPFVVHNFFYIGSEMKRKFEERFNSVIVYEIPRLSSVVLLYLFWRVFMNRSRRCQYRKKSFSRYYSVQLCRRNLSSTAPSFMASFSRFSAIICGHEDGFPEFCKLSRLRIFSEFFGGLYGSCM